MYVALAADGRRIAKLRGYFFDCCAEIALRLRRAVKGLKLIQRHRRKDRSRPGAEILRGYVLSGDFPEIIVDIA